LGYRQPLRQPQFILPRLVLEQAQASHTTDSETLIGKLFEGLRCQELLGRLLAPHSSLRFQQNLHGRSQASFFSRWVRTWSCDTYEAAYEHSARGRHAFAFLSLSA
jgi:hypothetical protein